MLDLAKTFGTPKPVLGMIHLAPLPGAPRYSGQMTDVLERALQDARALQAAGVDASMTKASKSKTLKPNSGVKALTCPCQPMPIPSSV